MGTLGLILMCFAFVFACISVKFWAIGGWNLLSVAIALWILAELFGGATRAGLVHFG